MNTTQESTSLARVCDLFCLSIKVSLVVLESAQLLVQNLVIDAVLEQQKEK